MSFAASPPSGPGRAERTSAKIASTTNSLTGNRRTRRCAGHELFCGHRRLRPRFLGASGVEQDLSFGGAIGIVDVDLHQEAVKLRFRQWIGALLFERVLRGEHVKRPRQIMARAGDGDVLLLHGLKQRRLGTRARAIDFVGHKKLSEHRAREKAEAAFAGLIFLKHFGAEDVRRHQVWRELNASRIEPEYCAQGFDEFGLGEPRHTEQERVAARQDCDERLLDDLVLAKDDRTDRGLGRAHVIGA